jgi:N-methylhydantoinase B
VLVDGELIGLVANRAHHADVGGEAPGSMPAHATDIAQEGHRVAPTRAVEHGEWVETFLDGFLAATRTPDERHGDLSAQLGANEVGARRLAELARALGPAATPRSPAACSTTASAGCVRRWPRSPGHLPVHRPPRGRR